MKSMSDGEVNDFVFKKLMGDLDGIEAEGMFNEKDPMEKPNEGTKVEAHGVSVHIKPMAGEQTEDMPAIEEDDDADEGPDKLGL